MPLAWLAQEDFSAGMVTASAPHLIPANGAREITNGLLDEDGSIYRRGGSSYVSNTPFELVSGGLTWIWHGHLVAGARTVFATDGSFGVLAADGATPIDLNGPGLTRAAHAAVVNGMLFIPGGYVYGGSLKSAPYSTGTIAVTQGSKTMTGTGTAWLANVDAGMLMASGPDAAARYYVVQSVDSDTQITLADPWEYLDEPAGTYTLKPLGPTAGMLYRTADFYATVAERLVTIEGARIYFSNGRDENGILKPHVFSEFDYHELPEGSLGLGAEEVRDLFVVFATDGVWTISNMAFDLTDAAGNVQQQMQRTSQNVVLAAPAALASYGGALVVPARDGVYLVDGVSAPVALSDAISHTYTAFVDVDAIRGGVVYKGHYLLSVSTGWLLACRIDRPVRIRGRTAFPWSQIIGHAGAVSFAVTADASPRLLGAGGNDGRVLGLEGMFLPTESNKNEADGTTHSFAVTTRDYPTGRGNINTVRRARVRYELVDAGTDNPGIAASYSPGTSSFTALAGEAAEDDGTGKHTWHLQADARYFRLRLESTDPAARLTIRSVEIAVRPSGKDR